MRKIQLAVFGSDYDHCSKILYNTALEVGDKLPPNEVILFTGGGKGVMEAASKGFYKIGGCVVGILPGSKVDEANEYCTLRIATGIGFARAQILANSVDAAIILGGGGGTLIEMLECYYRKVPLVALLDSGGVASQYANSYLDERNLIPVYSANNTNELVTKTIEHARQKISLENACDW